MEKKEVIRQLQAMQKNWEEQQRGIRLTEIDGSYQMCTAPEVYEYLIRIAKQPKKYVLTEVLMETLSIIAYKQPVTKSEIEKIRGVSCDHAVSKLVEYGLVMELGTHGRSRAADALWHYGRVFAELRHDVGGGSSHAGSDTDRGIQAGSPGEADMELTV